MRVDIEGRTLELVEGDITELDTDAIVNAANTHLVHGGGVAGVISRKGGPAIQAESNRLAPIGVGTAAITTGGKLKARHVIHTVGPRMGEGNEDEKLRGATVSALRLADERGLTSIAFPAVSAGIYRFPIDRCAQIMLRAAMEHLRGPTTLRRIVFCLYGADSYRVFEETLTRRHGTGP
ncbi:MAG TPA: macro domain-containing protein [Phycisphaerales bacterium]|nr:macro domain-containing protein [Phycisphaerales bacterium]